MVNEKQIAHDLHTYFEDPWADESVDPEYYTITGSGTVNLWTHISLKKPPPGGQIPIQFGKVNGDMSMNFGKLITLKGAPQEVTGDFHCEHNLLETLAHAPVHVSSFWCSHNRLTSLMHAPEVGLIHTLSCAHNLITTLDQAPPCGYLYACNNPLQSLKHTPGHIHTVAVTWAPDLPLLGLLNVHKEIHLMRPHMQDHRFTEVESILNAHVNQGRAGQIKCAAELIRSGYKANARL